MHTAPIHVCDEGGGIVDVVVVTGSRPRGGSIASVVMTTSNGETVVATATASAAVRDDDKQTTDGSSTICILSDDNDMAINHNKKKNKVAMLTANEASATLVTEKLKDVVLPSIAVREINGDDDDADGHGHGHEEENRLEKHDHVNGSDTAVTVLPLCEDQLQNQGQTQPKSSSVTSVSSNSQQTLTPFSTSTTAATTKAEAKTVAFAFDIDGVLMRGKTPVPGAREALLKLHALKIPFILLTNGGGHTEAAHVAQLGDRLSLPAGMLTEAQFVQSHTPFRDLVAEYRDQTILALGGSGQSVRNLALAYGFRRVVTSSDIMAWQDSVHPFPEMTRQHHAEHGRPLLTNTEGHGDDKNDKATRSEAAAAAAAAAAATATASTRISAILVFSSPRDWCLDLQIVTDLLLSEGGVVGGRRSPKNGDKTLPNRGYLQDGQPKLFFCNPDFEWATSHPHPRFAQGAFREALEGVWRFATRDAAAGGGEGVRLEYTIYGKPTDRTYVYGERVLQAYNERLQDELEEAARATDGDDDDDDYDSKEIKHITQSAVAADETQAGDTTTSAEPAAAAPTTAPSRRRRDISHVYMIGDNPESDIIGANSFSSRFGASWKSILVETGIYVAGTKPVHEPDHIARDVQTAVEWALMQHGQMH